MWDRLYEVPLGVDTALLRPTAPSVRIRSELGSGLRDRVVMFVGQLDRPHYFKGLPVLLRAMSGIDDPLVKLVVVGDGDMRASFSDGSLPWGCRQSNLCWARSTTSS